MSDFNTQQYLEEGDPCNQPGCTGKMIFHPVENCSCHLFPPCKACVENPLVCSECGYGEGEE